MKRRLPWLPWVAAALLGWLPAGPSSSQEAGACPELWRTLEEARHVGELAAKEAAYRGIRATAAAGGCRLLEAKVLNRLAVLELDRSRLALALDYLAEAGPILESLAAPGGRSGEDPAEIAALAGDVAQVTMAVLFGLGRFEEALEKLELTRRLHRRHPASATSQVGRELYASRIYRQMGNLEQARRGLASVRGLVGASPPRRQAAWHQERSRLLLEAERLDDAEKSLLRALEVLEQDRGAKSSYALDRANIVSDLAELALRRGLAAEALGRSDEALAWSARDGGGANLHFEAQVRHFRSRALAELGDPEAAAETADRGLALLDVARDLWKDLGIAFFAARERHFVHRFDLALKSRDAQDTWRLFEDFRARALFDRISVAGDPSVVPEGLRQAVERSRRRLVGAAWKADQWDPKVGTDRRPLEAEFLDALIGARELQARAAVEIGSRPSAPRLDPREAARLLDETLGLSFVAGSESVTVLVLEPRGELEALELEIGLAELVESSRAFTRAMRSREPVDVGQAAGLSAALLGPLAEKIDRFERLALVPGRAFEELPFGALPHPRTGRPLASTHGLAYLPSFSVLGALRQPRPGCTPPAAGLLALGDAIFGTGDARWPEGLPGSRGRNDEWGVPRLEASGEEVEGLRELHGPESLILVGPWANRDRFLQEAPRHRLVHLATHGRSDGEHPERSGVALSCIDEGGRVLDSCDLYLSDISGLELCGQVVVLSSCSSAGDVVLGGEGTLGLPRAFLEAGASTVIASLWSVGDVATARLMKAFHASLAAGLGSVEALRAAQRRMIEKGEPAASWAPFVVLGDWQVPDPGEPPAVPRPPPSSTSARGSGLIP